MTTKPNGFTMIEVVVVLALLGIVLGLSAVGVASLRPPARSTELLQLDSARRSAILSGALVRLGTGRAVGLLLPDGRGIGPNLDPLTGSPHDPIR